MKVLLTVVLYREQAAESRTVRSLQQALSHLPSLASALVISLWDNSLEPAPIPSNLFPQPFHIFQPKFNQGLAVAYNASLKLAVETGAEWLLLLDSDTEVSEAYLLSSWEYASKLTSNAHIAALVPHIVEGRAIHSPRLVTSGRRPVVPLAQSGVIPGELIALNSGTLIRVSAMQAIGGFDEDFWLDYLDYWFFRALQRSNSQVYVLPVTIEHSLSFSDPAGLMSPARYQNMLDAEFFFTARYGTYAERRRLRLVLLKRAVKLTLQQGGMPLARLALGMLLRSYRDARPPRAPASGT